jgi:hypothetical protein
MRGTPGELFRPANGTMGDIFTSQFCDRCTKDLHAPEGGGCPILLRSLVYMPDEEEYPREWRYDSEGHPECTAFDPVQETPTDVPA